LGGAAATAPILDRLADLLRDPKPDVWYEATQALGDLAGAAATAPILDRLANLLRDPNRGARAAAGAVTETLMAQGLRFFAQGEKGAWHVRTVTQLAGSSAEA
jgi:hypothetical protein